VKAHYFNWRIKMFNRIKFWLELVFVIPIYTIIFFIFGQKHLYNEYKCELKLAIKETKRKYNKN
jgi:hypothetical protein